MTKRKVEFVSVGGKRRLFCESLPEGEEEDELEYIKFAHPPLAEQGAGRELKIRKCYRSLYTLVEKTKAEKRFGGCVVAVSFG